MRLDPKLGILVPLRGDALAPVGVGTRDSAYTQVGVGPGVAEGTTGQESWRPVVTGRQTQAIDVRAVKGGYPARGDGATVITRLATETADTDWLGWSEPNLITGWTSPSDYQAADWTVFAAARRSDTGEIVVVGITAADGSARCWSYNPRTEAWTTRLDFAAASQPLIGPLAMAEDPQQPGRLLLWGGDGSTESALAYYSDDTGATWKLYALGTHLSGSSETRSSVGVQAARDWLLIHGTTQYGSSDRGVTWTTVEAITGELLSATHSVAVGPRGYIVGYLRDTDGHACVRVLQTGFSPFSAASEIVVRPAASENIQVAVDDDGIVYAYTWDTANEGHMRCFRSLNGGFSWSEYVHEVAGRVSVDYGRIFADAAVFSLGACHLVGDIDGAASACAMMVLGGWSNVDQGNSFEGTSAAALSRFGWSTEDVAAGEQAVIYIPADTPGNSGWTVNGAGAETLASGGLRTTGTGNARSYAWTLSSATAEPYLCGHWRGYVDGSFTRATSPAGIDCVLQSSGVTGDRLRIRFGIDGLRVTQSVGADVDYLFDATKPFELRWFMRQVAGFTVATLWYREVGAGPKWAIVLNEVQLDDLANTATTVEFGLIASGTGSLVTLMCGAALDCDWRYGLDALTDYGVSPVSGVRGIVVGKSLPPAGERYPVPQLGSSGVGYLNGIRGPVYTGEQFEIQPGYEYPVGNLDPLAETSPLVGWRATDTSLVTLVYDATLARWRGGALALVAIGASFRTATISVDDGSTGWTTLGTMDKGWDVECAIVGTCAYPAAGGAIDRYIHEGELVGGYLIVEDGVSEVARRIVASTAGYWSADAADVPRVRLTLAGVDGSELSGSARIVAPSGVLVVYPAESSAARRYLRVQIPAAQVVPADGGEDGATAAYSAGKLFACSVVSAGLDAEWRVQGSYQLPATITRRRDGAPSMVRTGPARRSLTYSWPAVPAHPMRSRLASTRDYIGVSGGIALAAGGDAWTTIPRVVDALDGSPLVLVPALPAAAATYTDPTTWLYGLAVSTSLQVVQSGGLEGRDEVVSLAGLSVEELT